MNPQPVTVQPGHKGADKLERAEVATCFVFLASDDGRDTAGRVLHPNGGEIVNG